MKKYSIKMLDGSRIEYTPENEQEPTDIDRVVDFGISKDFIHMPIKGGWLHINTRNIVCISQEEISEE